MKVRDLPPVFRQSHAKAVIGVTDETILKWAAQPGSCVRIYRVGGICMVDTQSVLDYIKSQPSRPRTNRGRKAA